MKKTAILELGENRPEWGCLQGCAISLKVSNFACSGKWRITLVLHPSTITY
jgi:hypothetical protein